MSEEIELTSHEERGTIFMVGAILALIIAFLAYKIYRTLQKKEVEDF